MNKDGFVPFQLISGFNRIKQLTLETDIIKEAIRTSKVIELSQDEEGVRLRDGWDRWLLQQQ